MTLLLERVLAITICLVVGIICVRSPMIIERLLLSVHIELSKRLGIKNERYELLDSNPQEYAVRYKSNLGSHRFTGYFAITLAIIILCGTMARY